jgi:hypothetical protein
VQRTIAEVADIKERRWTGRAAPEHRREAEPPAAKNVDDETEPPIDRKLILAGTEHLAVDPRKERAGPDPLLGLMPQQRGQRTNRWQSDCCNRRRDESERAD